MTDIRGCVVSTCDHYSRPGFESWLRDPLLSFLLQTQRLKICHNSFLPYLF